MIPTQGSRFAQVIVTALVCLLLPVARGSIVTTLNPVADAFVTTGPAGSQSITNFGLAGALAVSAPGSAKGEFQSVMQFDLSSAKSLFDAQFGVGSWTIQSITLQLSNAPPNNNIFNASSAGQFTVSWMQNDSWQEGNGTPQTPTTTGITFSTISNFVGMADESLGNFSYNGATSGSTTVTLGLTPGFSADVLLGGLVSFRFFAADNAVSSIFNSRNFPQASGRPVLSIVAVPEPGTGRLLGAAAAIGLSWRRQERKLRG